ncbi:MAG: hypothetical protein LBU85_02015 [Treponema sp.]|jgi:hypothetical protein|nr:hypothetical protein [Treponema sp.]
MHHEKQTIHFLTVSFTFTSCDELFEEIATTTTYYFYNYSSRTVAIFANGKGWASGSVTLLPGQSTSGEFGSLSLQELYYTPSNYVSVSLSGTSFSFWDK